MNFFFITNEPSVGELAEEAGVDRIMVDLEVNGKVERQGHLDTVISGHQIEDVSALRDKLTTSELVVRCNPLFEGSRVELDEIISRGADRIMLPMFHSHDQASRFVDLIGGRCKVTLLMETATGLARLPQIAEVSGVDDIHIGLNDLHLDLGLNFMFEILSEGLLEHVSGVVKSAGRKFGFGGVAPLRAGVLPAEKVLSEHKRLGSQQVILSRDFCKLLKGEDPQGAFTNAVAALRAYWTMLRDVPPDTLEQNRAEVRQIVRAFVAKRVESS